MRPLSRVFAVAGLLVLAGSVGLEAQSRKFVSLGGGLTMPTGDFKNEEEAKSGWMTGAALGTGIGSGNLFVMASGFYGKNGSDHAEDETTTLTGGTLNVGLMSGGEMVRLYGYAGAGLQHYKNNEHLEDNGTSVLGNAAVGLNIGRGTTRFWVQGGLAMNTTASYIPVLAGISIGF